MSIVSRLVAARPLALCLCGALLLASCAGGGGPIVAPEAVPAPPSGPPKLVESNGAKIAFAEFNTSAFPYHGLIPNPDDPGKAKPFMDVNQAGRLGHSSPRGGLYWEDATYNDRHVLFGAASDFDPHHPGAIVIFFHGNQATLARDVVERQQAVRQIAQSSLNGVLVAPQLAVDALDSSAGRFWQRGSLAEFLSEAEEKLARLYPKAPRAAFRRMPVIIVAYSGGYLPAAYALALGGAEERVRGVVLFDALYGEEDKFVNWIEENHNRAFFVSAFSKSSQDGNVSLQARLTKGGLAWQTALPDVLESGVVAFVDAGDVRHEDFVNSAWTADPLRDILSRVGR